ncbi:hypothetical protein DFQ01_109139 [Paenibacillus cellulosilyticus]|uniref:Uncharacterized protein n=1 Tax=Paenibacillus cellulosilyticus TaxID=375489 RepID=A0A2V2YWX0_9BACL|nr:hypothetical protein [Paenibacillus cellulosilyticus]PWW02514.1 hypothetical protein DFQ01_109139 [Paenibacillus cellulosilyticus]QKS47213.1 hypothetical protein HUB94_22500 [Paenibacillus cellulosilyticus]
MKMIELEKLLSVSYQGEKSLAKIYMPNEIFSDLIYCDELTQGKKSSDKLSVAYSYTYLCHWLYWTCKWNADYKITQDDLKQILGYSRDNKTLLPIIKENGVIDQLGYTLKTTDYPVEYTYEDGYLDFITIGDLKKSGYVDKSHNDRNFCIKYPLKAFHRTTESLNVGDLDGTFYEVGNTHHVPFEVFLYCMSKDDLGTIGFYLYSFLSHKCDLYGKAQYSRGRFVGESGVKETSLNIYLKALEKYNMIDVDGQDFVFDLPEHLREANVYSVNHYNQFGARWYTRKPRAILSLETYNEKNGDKKAIKAIKVDELEALPF